MNKLKVQQAWFLLKVTYTIVPIILGLDKCFIGLLVNWAHYVSPTFEPYLPLAVSSFLIMIGMLEIVTGFIVWFYPRIGAYTVLAWMTIVVINLASTNTFYDIILRDITIGIGALTLAWLSEGLEK